MEMLFEFKYGGYEATNALKPVLINESNGRFWLDMPKGTLYDNKHITQFFQTFDEAKRYAETYVGFTCKMGELIASA